MTQEVKIHKAHEMRNVHVLGVRISIGNEVYVNVAGEGCEGCVGDESDTTCEALPLGCAGNQYIWVKEARHAN